MKINYDLVLEETLKSLDSKKTLLIHSCCGPCSSYVLNYLKDYFDSFNFGRVRGFFLKDADFKVPEEIATVIAQIACYKGKLPQGAPSSPIITNLISRMIMKMKNLIK